MTLYEMDAAAEIDTVGAVVDVDQHRECVSGAGLVTGGLGHPFGPLAAHFARDQRAVETECSRRVTNVKVFLAAARLILRPAPCEQL
jgi:hypothetical protein